MSRTAGSSADVALIPQPSWIQHVLMKQGAFVLKALLAIVIAAVTLLGAFVLSQLASPSKNNENQTALAAVASAKRDLAARFQNTGQAPELHVASVTMNHERQVWVVDGSAMWSNEGGETNVALPYQAELEEVCKDIQKHACWQLANVQIDGQILSDGTLPLSTPNPALAVQNTEGAEPVTAGASEILTSDAPALAPLSAEQAPAISAASTDNSAEIAADQTVLLDDEPTPGQRPNAQAEARAPATTLSIDLGFPVPLSHPRR